VCCEALISVKFAGGEVQHHRKSVVKNHICLSWLLNVNLQHMFLPSTVVPLATPSLPSLVNEWISLSPSPFPPPLPHLAGLKNEITLYCHASKTYP